MQKPGTQKSREDDFINIQKIFKCEIVNKACFLCDSAQKGEVRLERCNDVYTLLVHPSYPDAGADAACLTLKLKLTKSTEARRYAKVVLVIPGSIDEQQRSYRFRPPPPPPRPLCR